MNIVKGAIVGKLTTGGDSVLGVSGWKGAEQQATKTKTKLPKITWSWESTLSALFQTRQYEHNASLEQKQLLFPPCFLAFTGRVPVRRFAFGAGFRRFRWLPTSHLKRLWKPYVFAAVAFVALHS